MIDVKGATIINSDCIEAMQLYASLGMQFDACVTDPPYHLASVVKRFGKEGAAPAQHGTDGAYVRASKGFMGQSWDGGDISMRPETWRAVYDVLKPGGHLVCFGGTKSFHRIACAIEDAGFELRDTAMWIYGCLDDQTQAVTMDGVKSHKDIQIGDLVLCYEVATGEYSYQPVLEVFSYAYDDTAYRLIADAGEQIVSRNHRCIVERSGVELFQFAEHAAQECEARVPFLESLQDLQRAISNAQPDASSQECDVRRDLHSSGDFGGSETVSGSSIQEQRQDEGNMLRMQQGGLPQHQTCEESEEHRLLLSMQRSVEREGLEEARLYWARELEDGIRAQAGCANDWGNQSSLEGRFDLSEPQRRIHQSADQICAMPAGYAEYGESGRLRDGAQIGSRSSFAEAVDSGGNSASYQSRRDRQFTQEFDAVCDERSTQKIRAWPGHKTSMVRIVPFHHTGEVWCLRVPTGAFVAVRGGVAFPTGNSGFPKSHDVSKGIDKALGAQREQVEPRSVIAHQRNIGNTRPYMDDPNHKTDSDEPASDEARRWDGWGTALKPAYEPILICRKPLIGTVAENVLTHGTGGINIDGCRVATDAGKLRVNYPSQDKRYTDSGSTNFAMKPEAYTGGNPMGRWPANVIHDGSDEVISAFPEVRGDSGSAARFYYSAKANAKDRAGSKHPTVKPVSLIRYLMRLVTPPGGTILDPFAGSGTAGEAAYLEGFKSVLIEQSQDYYNDICNRMNVA